MPGTGTSQDKRDAWVKRQNMLTKHVKSKYKKCNECGLRMRGPNHIEGQHHKDRSRTLHKT